MICRPSLFVLAASALALACSTNPPLELADAGPSDAGSNDAGTHDAGTLDAGSNDAGTADAGSNDAGSSDAGGDGGACAPGGPYGGGEESYVPGMVTAALVDETGAPVAAGQPFYLCGLDVCSAPGFTTDAGIAVISTGLTEKAPAFKFGDAINYAEFTISLETNHNVDFTDAGTGKVATGKLSDKPGAALAPGTSAVSGDVTIALAADTVVGIDTLTYGTADQQLFRAVSIPLTNAQSLFPDGSVSDIFAIYGVAPANTTFCPPAQVTATLPPGLGLGPVDVEFYINTGDVSQTYGYYGSWTFVSEGVISADGKTATTTGGQGFPVLNNFGIRIAQAARTPAP